jgi:hypothetical protein
MSVGIRIPNFPGTIRSYRQIAARLEDASRLRSVFILNLLEVLEGVSKQSSALIFKC